MAAQLDSFLRSSGPILQVHHYAGPRTDRPRIASFSRTAKRQNSSKSHLFYELKNTLIYTVTSCYHFDTTDTDFPQIESQKMSNIRSKTQFAKKLSGVKVFN
ncbi:MAG: hypothetical protein ACYTEX_25440, partial [Planctomycetota bacterium]